MEKEHKRTEMENSVVMKGGEDGYFRNSKIQQAANNRARNLQRKSIEEFLELENDSKVFTIADLGCSVGPNTFSSVKNIIEAVKHKYSTCGHDLKQPEFQVFFNDQVTNDFNTLFKALPSDRQYKAAAAPGSFLGEIFPKSSMKIMNSSFTHHFLSRIPEEVTEQGSPQWNKGRITYALSSGEVGEAFRAQFSKDMETFFNVKSAELAPGGLVVIFVPGRPEGTSPCESIIIHTIACLGDALADMVKEGLVSENLVDCFNLLLFFPTSSEVKQAVSSTEHLRIERSEEIQFPAKLSSPGDIHVVALHVRAVLEPVLSNHFGPSLTDELFKRYPEKLDKFFKTPRFAGVEKLECLLLVVKRI